MRPFWRGLHERAGKSLVGGIVSFLVTDWVQTLVSLNALEQAAAYAAGVTLFSVLASFVSRPFGPKDSPSLVKETP